MQTISKTTKFDHESERIAIGLRLIGWLSFWLQLGLGIVSALMLEFAIAGRNFNQAMTQDSEAGITNVSEATASGVGVGIFWAICGILVLLFNIYLAFRYTRFGKRLRNPNPAMQPEQIMVLSVLRLSIIVGLFGMLMAIIGTGSTLGILLAKSISQPQGVTVYDPIHAIRSLDILIAMANMGGIAAHFTGTASSFGLFNWLHRQ
ncbi:DUF3611 family protein [Leptolyngbya sp. FACHB-541]|uniref:DUF3611 family protein n=1 Tax=Leptolyngbya sp. FACHB-541 TaxID=2692810 RepID=UPI0016825DA1|nr:DUF3611 family protein [Leptolyngbya sp. FACHB-541]MBD1997382.1 DUF3611 family protein [Leptolyngbya sp. FACHB-541]